MRNGLPSSALLSELLEGGRRVEHGLDQVVERATRMDEPRKTLSLSPREISADLLAALGFVEAILEPSPPSCDELGPVLGV